MERVEIFNVQACSLMVSQQQHKDYYLKLVMMQDGAEARLAVVSVILTCANEGDSHENIVTHTINGWVDSVLASCWESHYCQNDTNRSHACTLNISTLSI